MRAVRIHAKHDMRTEQVPGPEPGPGEVRLRVSYVGICGSDLHYYADGTSGIFAIREPLIPGHEVSGVVQFLIRVARWSQAPRSRCIQPPGVRRSRI